MIFGDVILAESSKTSVLTSKRVKRHEKNVIIEEVDEESIHTTNNFLKSGEERNINRDKGSKEKSSETRFTKILHDLTKTMADNENENTMLRLEKGNEKQDNTHSNSWPQLTTSFEESDDVEASGKEFALYEIENPVLWFNVHVHLFEKLSTPNGNTLWNDVTKGEPVSVSSMSPDWRGPDMNVHYKPDDFVTRDDFLLPKSSLCLLVPLVEESMNTESNNMNYAFDISADKDANYILVPSEDILNVDKTSKTKRTLDNVSADDTNEQRRTVVVRVARALWNIMEDKLTIVNQAADKYLTMMHRGKRRAQVDLEVRADDNQLVHVSPPGRIAIIVTDNTRGTRSTVTVQATNTGLFAARFRAQIRECDSGLLNLAEKQASAAESEPVLLPPRQTRRLQLPLPGGLADVHHCSVYLLNENDQAVAVRDAVIKKGDQCYCVWHCDCVCYGDNPKLACQEMSAARQDAAGLPPRRGARFSRACCYSDVTAINVAVVMIGVIAMLLIFGVLKGLVGLVCPRVGAWGLDRVLETPRQIDHYYESSLRGRQVVYDSNYWPVHPDTGERTVRVVSLPVEFILNVVYFVVIPGLLAVDIVKHINRKTCEADRPASETKVNVPKHSKNKNVRHDVQGREPHPRRRRLARRSWMTPEAKDLSECIWTHTSTLIGPNKRETMFPLLNDERCRPQLEPAQTSGSDSELEDTAFVLMHMQKSTESLARNQMKPSAINQSTDSDHTVKQPLPVGQDGADIRLP